MSISDDEASFNEFVSGRFSALARTAYLLTGNHHDAEDLVQSALTKAAGVWPRISHHPEPYVRRILYNDNISRWRKRRVTEHSTADPSDEPSDDEAARSDIATKVTLQRALAKLTPKQRTVLVLRYYEDLTEKQAAAAMGVSVGTIKSQTRHALMRIRHVAPDLADLVEAGT